MLQFNKFWLTTFIFYKNINYFNNNKGTVTFYLITY